MRGRSFGAYAVLAALLQACSATPPAGVTADGSAEVKPAVVDPLEVQLDTRVRADVALRMEVVDANDRTQGQHLAKQLEPFRACLNRYRQPRGYAGGRIGIVGTIRADGVFEQGNASSLDFSDGLLRCIAADVAALRWPETDIERVGFVGAVLVHDSSRRAPNEIRPWRSSGRSPSPTLQSSSLDWSTPEPLISWSSIQGRCNELNDSGSDKEMAAKPPQNSEHTNTRALAQLEEGLTQGSGVLSDCLWHAWPTAAPSATATLSLRLEPSGALSGTLRGEGAPPPPELQECVGRMVSVMTGPKATSGCVVYAQLSVGPGATSLRGR